MYFIFGTILINNAFQFSTFEVWKHSRTEVEIISPRGRVHRCSSLSRSDDVVCHNFTSDRIKGAAARPTTKILLLAHEPLAPGSLAPLPLFWGQPSEVAGAQVHTRETLLPHGARTTDLTPRRFLQFGFLENQCADGYPFPEWVLPLFFESKSRHWTFEIIFSLLFGSFFLFFWNY